ncbi:hypothetical protein ACOMHN_001295 [Nucella lapillus]
MRLRLSFSMCRLFRQRKRRSKVAAELVTGHRNTDEPQNICALSVHLFLCATGRHYRYTSLQVFVCATGDVNIPLCHRTSLSVHQSTVPRLFCLLTSLTSIMAEGRCAQCVRYFLIIFNFVFWLSGGVIAGVGVYVLMSDQVESSLSSLIDMTVPLEVVYTAACSLIGVGSFVFFVGFCGCCGAMRESAIMLGIYTACMAVVMLGEVSAGIYVAVEKGNLIMDGSVICDVCCVMDGCVICDVTCCVMDGSVICGVCCVMYGSVICDVTCIV